MKVYCQNVKSNGGRKNTTTGETTYTDWWTLGQGSGLVEKMRLTGTHGPSTLEVKRKVNFSGAGTFSVES